MSTPSLDTWLLVNYAGYPFAPNSLMPDNGLANLAGALHADGRTVRILDYCTVGMVERMTSPELRSRLAWAWDTLRASGRGPVRQVKRLAALAILQRGEKERRRLQERAVSAIADEVVAHILKYGVTAVGFKLWNGDGLDGAGHIARRVREKCPGVRVFGGGPHVDLFSSGIARHYPFFHALVYGEGEETIRRLAATGGDEASYEDIPNLIYGRDGAARQTPERMVASLDDLPLPIYDPEVYLAMAGHEKIKVAVIDESRGCRNECAFCIHPVKSHRQIRLKSIARLVQEVRLLGNRYGFHSFRFAGSCTPYSLLNGFAGEVIRQGLPLRYASFAHIRDSDEADFELIGRSGCVALFFGLESGSQRILDAMRKRVKVEQILTTLRRAREAGIFTVGSLIFPAPGEDAASETDTLDLLKQAPLKSVMLSAPVIAPRTDWFESPERYGIHFRNKASYLDEALTWKVKLQLPPRFWSPLPVSVDGRTYPQVLAKAGSMARRIADLGIPTSISDETYLMSVDAGIDATEFRNTALAAFFAGDTGTIRPLVERINRGA